MSGDMWAHPRPRPAPSLKPPRPKRGLSPPQGRSGSSRCGYIVVMPNELQDLMADLEVSLVETVARVEQAEMDLLCVDMLHLEQRIEALHDALASVADTIAQRSVVSN